MVPNDEALNKFKITMASCGCSNMAFQDKRGYQPSGRQQGSHPGSYLVDLPDRAQVPPQSDAEGGDGLLPPHLHVDVHHLCLNRACGGHVDASNEAPLQC